MQRYGIEDKARNTHVCRHRFVCTHYLSLCLQVASIPSKLQRSPENAISFSISLRPARHSAEQHCHKALLLTLQYIVLQAKRNLCLDHLHKVGLSPPSNSQRVTVLRTALQSHKGLTPCKRDQ